MMTGSPLLAAIMLSVFGVILIWKGLIGDVIATRLGESLLPRWLYIVAGIVFLMLSSLFFLALFESGRKLIGL